MQSYTIPHTMLRSQWTVGTATATPIFAAILWGYIISIVLFTLSDFHKDSKNWVLNPFCRSDFAENIGKIGVEVAHCQRRPTTTFIHYCIILSLLHVFFVEQSTRSQGSPWPDGRFWIHCSQAKLLFESLRRGSRTSYKTPWVHERRLDISF